MSIKRQYLFIVLLLSLIFFTFARFRRAAVIIARVPNRNCSKIFITFRGRDPKQPAFFCSQQNSCYFVDNESYRCRMLVSLYFILCEKGTKQPR